MRIALLLLVVLVTPAHAWQPPSGGPSKMAKRVLDSLTDPKNVPIPHAIEERSREEPVIVTTDAFKSSPGPPSAKGWLIPVDTSLTVGCWQVQITAVSDADRARDLASQESSKLGVPVHVVMENALAKVRAGEDCMSYDDATKLRDKARDSGYPGAFVIRQAGGSGS